MGQFTQFAINGLMSGSIYALIALGIVAVYKATRVVNFAHGYMIMMGAYLYYQFAVLLPFTPWAPDWLRAWSPEWLINAKAEAAMFSPRASYLNWLENLPRIAFGIFGSIAGCAIIGSVIERILMRPLLGQSQFSMIMITVGLISVLAGLNGIIWTADAASVPHLVPNIPIRLSVFGTPIFIFGADLANMAIALILFALITLWIRYSKVGVAIQATAEDQSTAYSMGISVPNVFGRAWIIATGTGAIAGSIIATRSGVSPSIGLFGFSVLAIVLMGGLDSFLGVLIAALCVGILEAMVQWKLGGEWAAVSPYIAVLIVILIRPHGLLGQKEVERL